MTKPTLTARQAMFVSEFCVDSNATAAAIRAGYSAKTARQQGALNMAKAAIVSEIAKRQSKRLKRNDVTAERVVAQLAATAFHDPLNAFDANGNLRPLDQIDPATRSAMVIEITEGFDQEGNPVQTRKTKFLDRHVSLDKLARNLGLLQDKLKISGDVQNPLHHAHPAHPGIGHQARPRGHDRGLRLSGLRFYLWLDEDRHRLSAREGSRYSSLLQFMVPEIPFLDVLQKFAAWPGGVGFHLKLG